MPVCSKESYLEKCKNGAGLKKDEPKKNRGELSEDNLSVKSDLSVKSAQHAKGKQLKIHKSGK